MLYLDQQPPGYIEEKDYLCVLVKKVTFSAQKKNIFEILNL